MFRKKLQDIKDFVPPLALEDEVRNKVLFQAYIEVYSAFTLIETFPIKFTQMCMGNCVMTRNLQPLMRNHVISLGAGRACVTSKTRTLALQEWMLVFQRLPLVYRWYRGRISVCMLLALSTTARTASQLRRCTG